MSATISKACLLARVSAATFEYRDVLFQADPELPKTRSVK
jgi:hypothetical protein